MATKNVNGVEVVSPEPSTDERREAMAARERRIQAMFEELEYSEEFDWQIAKIKSGDVGSVVKSMKDWAKEDMMRKK